MVPDMLLAMLSEQRFSFVHVPYKIKPFEDLILDPFNSIIFDEELDNRIEERTLRIGSDGALLHDQQGNIHKVSLIEKLLIIYLVKTTNFVPDGGIWMNTQRPEWNDANNALAGWGLSMVTLEYLIRSVHLTKQLLKSIEEKGKADMVLGDLTFEFLQSVLNSLQGYAHLLETGFSNVDRWTFMSTLGLIGSSYRCAVYEYGVTEVKHTVSLSPIFDYLDILETYLFSSVHKNKRSDGMYHAYNVLKMQHNSIELQHLPLMLEGQVAVLSSGVLSTEEAVTLLDVLRDSSLYREDQNSYMLYPRSHVKGFIDRNTIGNEQIEASELLKTLMATGDTSLVNKDSNGVYHFNGRLSSREDVSEVLEALSEEESLHELVKKEQEKIVLLYEEVFEHDTYTGRSGRMFAYEGNGSIYWHMVSKLLVAAQENLIRARVNKEGESLLMELYKRYASVRSGLGYQKSAYDYGAFPMDPYSHTAWLCGAKQPGLTGHVKEELLTRTGELGLRFVQGSLVLDPFYFCRSEFLEAEDTFTYYDVKQNCCTLQMPCGTAGFSYCQVPVIYHTAEDSDLKIIITRADGREIHHTSHLLPKEVSKNIMQRDGTIERIDLWMDFKLLPL